MGGLEKESVSSQSGLDGFSIDISPPEELGSKGTHHSCHRKTSLSIVITPTRENSNPTVSHIVLDVDSPTDGDLINT